MNFYINMGFEYLKRFRWFGIGILVLSAVAGLLLWKNSGNDSSKDLNFITLKSRVEPNVVILGSGMSMGIPFNHPNWVEMLEQDLKEVKDESMVIEKILDPNLSLEGMLRLKTQWMKPGLKYLILQISPADLILEDAKLLGGLPCYATSSANLRQWPSEWDPQHEVASLNALKEILRITSQSGIKVLVLGPASCQWQFPALRQKQMNRKASFEAEVMGIATLADKNQTESPQYALRCYERLTKLEPELSAHHYAKAEQLFRMNRLEEAKVSFLASWEHDELPYRGKPSWLNELKNICKMNGVTYVDVQKKCDALSPYGLASFSEFYDALHPREFIHNWTGYQVYQWLEEGKKKSKKVSEKGGIAPESVELWLKVSRHLFSEYNFSASWTTAQRAVEISPKNLEALEWLMFLSHIANDPIFMGNLAMVILKDHPYHEMAWRSRLWIELASVGPEGTQPLLASMPFIFWEIPEALVVQALILEKQDQVDLARELLVKAEPNLIDDALYIKIMTDFYTRHNEGAGLLKFLEIGLQRSPNELPLALAFAKQVLVESYQDPSLLQTRWPWFVELLNAHPKDMKVHLLHLMGLWRLEQWAWAEKFANGMLYLSKAENIPLSWKRVEALLAEIKAKKSVSLSQMMEEVKP